MKKIVIDQKKCIGCGTCALLAPKTFKIDKNGKAEVISQTASPGKKVNEAIASCPVEAISYQEED